VRRLIHVAFTAILFASVTSVAFGHTSAPTNLVVTGSTEASVSLDWTQDYLDSYSGYFVRVDGGARVKYPQSGGTVSGLRPSTTYRFCMSIDFTLSTHPDESNQACITTTTKGTAPTPTPTPTATPTPEPPPPSSYPRFAWTRAAGVQAEFDRVRALGFTHAMVNPDSAQLAKIANAGLRAVVWGGNYDDVNCAWRWSNAIFSQKLQQAEWSIYGGLIDYVFVADEPHSAASGGCAASPQHMRERVALSKSILPNTPTLISENRREDFANLAGIADVFGPVRYPCSYSSGCVLSKIDETVAQLNADGITNWWPLVQSFREPSGGYYRAPTATELQQVMNRWEAGGPDGMVAYAWGDGCCGDDVGLRDLPALWPVWQAENPG
jgi:hypothetical protein